MARILILRSDHPDWVKVMSPFHDEWVDTFKAVIPGAARRPVYSPLDKKFAYWLVLKGYLNELATLFDTYFPDEEIESDLEAEGTLSLSDGNCFAPLFARCPKDQQRNLYIALIKIFHPDVGGSSELAAQLNQAYREGGTP